MHLQPPRSHAACTLPPLPVFKARSLSCPVARSLVRPLPREPFLPALPPRPLPRTTCADRLDDTLRLSRTCSYARERALNQVKKGGMNGIYPPSRQPPSSIGPIHAVGRESPSFSHCSVQEQIGVQLTERLTRGWGKAFESCGAGLLAAASRARGRVTVQAATTYLLFLKDLLWLCRSQSSVRVGRPCCPGIPWEPTRETYSRATRQGTLSHGRLNSLSHCRLRLKECN